MSSFSSPPSFLSALHSLHRPKPFHSYWSKLPRKPKPLTTPKQAPSSFVGKPRDSSFDSVVTRAEPYQAEITSPIPSDCSADDSPADLVKRFYEGINRHDLESVTDLIADACIYEDLIFPRPFVGRKAIMEFFKKFTDSISRDLQFVIDDISGNDSSAVGVTWHLEWKGRVFPFSKGCSFYRLEVINGKRQIIFGRDSVEPALKPGELALVAIGGVTRLLERFPQLTDLL